MLMASSVVVLDFHFEVLHYPTVFTSRDALGLRLIEANNLLENQGLEKASSGRVIG